jgi:hypothetical protein
VKLGLEANNVFPELVRGLVVLAWPELLVERLDLAKRLLDRSHALLL